MLPNEQDFDAFLSDISTCFINRDLATWRDRILLPFSFITRDGPIVIATEEAVAESFANYLAACDMMGLDVIDRTPIAFEDCRDGTWLGTYETRLISRGVLATRAYTSTALLIWDGGMLRMTSMLNARGHHEWTGIKPFSN